MSLKIYPKRAPEPVYDAWWRTSRFMRNTLLVLMVVHSLRRGLVFIGKNTFLRLSLQLYFPLSTNSIRIPAKNNNPNPRPREFGV
jgi:hypothetical protein